MWVVFIKLTKLLTFLSLCMPKKKTPAQTASIFNAMTKAMVSGNPKPNKELKKLKDAEIALERAGKLDDDVRLAFDELKDKARKNKSKKQ